MNNNILKVRNKIKRASEKGYAEGNISATRDYGKSLLEMKKEHDRQINQLLNTHKRELKLMEKEYNIKATRMDRKIQRLDGLIEEWEKKMEHVTKISSQSNEMLARIKQALYQDRKKYANILDDEYILKTLQSDLSGLASKAEAKRNTSAVQ